MKQQETVHQAIIIGSGFGGLGMARHLRKMGIHKFVVLEKSDSIGGTWRDNTYPGAACDVPSHLYSFSFHLNPNWSQAFSPQREIQDYLLRCLDCFDLHHHVRYQCEVATATFDEEHALWQVTLTNGDVLLSQILISATGQLSRPQWPDIPGRECFQGKQFHSAQWDHGYSMQNRKVAVIGTGASAIQFVPEVAKQASHVTVFQRSAPWIIPKPDRAFTGMEKALFKHAPLVMKLYRGWIYSKLESRALAFSRMSFLLDLLVGRPFHALLEESIPDPDLRQKLVPDYPIGCKRILISNDYLTTLARPNVSVVTDDIREIDKHGVVTAEGTHYPVDTMVFGTGFAATDFLSPMSIHGRQGKSLNEVWQQGAEAYLGMSVPGFPNFFMLYGPNTNLGHNSIIYMLESQMRHIVRCLKKMNQDNVKRIEVNASEFDTFNRRIHDKLQQTVWAQCQSWYVDKEGHSSANWPGFTLNYRWQACVKSLGAYQFS